MLAETGVVAGFGGLSTDSWTAIGTIALAVVTLVTLIATIVISWRSDKQLRAERSATREAEELAEAYAIQVIGGEGTALVVNHGKYTITEVNAQLRLAD